MFAIGTTKVILTVCDAASNTSTGGFTVTVQSLAGFQSTFLVDRSKGVFTGSVVDLVTKQKTRLKGVVPQSQEKVLGFYVKDTGVGNWSLLPVSLPR